MKIIEEEMKKDIVLLAKLRGIDAAIEELEARRADICRGVLAGALSLRDAADRAFRPHEVAMIMRAQGWSFSPSSPAGGGLSSSRPDRFRAMSADRDRHLAGAPLAESAWLFQWGGDLGPGCSPYAEEGCLGCVPPAGRDAFFRLCDAALVPVEHYLAPPEGMPVPRYSAPARDGMLRIEAGGDARELLLADDPVGREFELPLDGGGALRVRVSSAEPEYDSSPHGDEALLCVWWEGWGSVEGYTSPAARPIELVTYDDRIGSLRAADLGDEDARAALSYWADFFRWRGRRESEVEGLRLAMLRGCCEALGGAADEGAL